MEAAEFWKTIQEVHEQSGGDMDAKVDLLTGRLQAQTPDEVLVFTRAFDSMMDRAYTWDLWGAAYVIQGGCSDDGFMDFRSSLISMGEDVFEGAVSSPDGLADLPPDTIKALFFEGFNYAATSVYEEKTGSLPEREGQAPDDPTGEPWDEDEAELAKRFPRLWAKYGESPVAFFVLTFLLSVPFYILNALAYLDVLFEPAMGALYISAFTLTPITSASILTFRRRGWYGVRELLGRILDLRRIARIGWYAPILLLTPLIFLLSLGVMVLSGAPIPPALAPAVALPAVFPFFFILAAGEEVGWMGYAFEPMQAQGGALRASLVLGMIWAVWHLPFFVFMMPDPVILLAQMLKLVGIRVLAAWIFNNTGKSVFAAILFHAADNTALVTVPEVQAISPWGPVVTCALVLAAAAVVALLWGRGTLARFRFGNQG